jgi:hypothetical protein
LDDIAGRFDGRWYVARSTGTQFVTEHWTTWSPTADWRDVSVGDFNGDGRDDLAGRAGGAWWVAKSNGTAFVTEHWATWSSTTAWQDVQVGDVNGDELDDILGRGNGVWQVAKSTGTNFVNESWGTWSTAVTWDDVLVGNFSNAIPAALHADGAPPADALSAPAVTEDALPALGEAAFSRFTTGVGLDDSIDFVPSITFQVADSPGTLLGQALRHTILIDRDATGFGWFVDLTPREDEEFSGATHDGRLAAGPGTEADGRMDLLTAVMHELGHVLGYEHSDAGLMRESLLPGVRSMWDDGASEGDEVLLDQLAGDPLGEAPVDEFFASVV